MVQSLTETGILHVTVHDTLFGVLSFNVRPPRLKILNTSIVNKEKQCLYIFSMHKSAGCRRSLWRVSVRSVRT